MKILDNMKTGTKLIGGFVVIALIMVGLVGNDYLGMSRLNEGMLSLYNDRLVPLGQAGDAQTLVYTIRGDLFRLTSFQRTKSLLKWQLTNRSLN